MGLNKNEELKKTANEIAAAVKDFDGDQHTQARLLNQIDKLRYLLENPLDVWTRQWEMTTGIAALHLLTELGVFEKMPAEGPISTKDLASLLEIEESAIARALRITVMLGIGEEVAPDVFQHNDKSRAYLPGSGLELFRLIYDQTPPFMKLPEYFKTHSREDLYDLKKSPFAYGHGLEGMTYYEAISHTPERLHMFNTTMVQMEQSVPILGLFPFASMKEEVEAEKDRPFVVDIGGGQGQALIALQKEAPAGFGAKLILQDRAVVLDKLPDERIPNIEKMVYDFHTPQPVKNAHVYFIRRILHDFYDPVCIELLKNIASAMGPKSRLVIADNIRPERTDIGGDMFIYWMDFNMMMINGKEKSESEFEEIIGAAGLEIVNIWRYPVGTHSHIECRLKQG